MKHCIVIGNGPSSKELLLLEQEKKSSILISAYTIGCNRVYSGVAAAAVAAVALDVLLAADVWLGD